MVFNFWNLDSFFNCAFFCKMRGDESKSAPLDPHHLGCLFSGNCDFCQDKDCGTTEERTLVRDLTNPLIAQGWKLCEKKECNLKYQMNLSLYRTMTMTQLQLLYPDPVTVVRTSGQVEKDWIIAGNLIRYEHQGPLFLTVAVKNPSGSIKLHKSVPYETFRKWQEKS